VSQTQVIRRVVKPAVFLAALEPFGWLVYNAFFGDLGVNPVETITNQTGIWTLRFIVLTLALTPLRYVTGFNPFALFRRMLGLFAFFYGTLHFMTYFILDHSLEFSGVWDDVLKRPYITAGFTAFVLMIPLALTSTQGWIRRLGGKRWNLLHRLLVESEARYHEPAVLRGGRRGAAGRARLAAGAQGVGQDNGTRSRPARGLTCATWRSWRERHRRAARPG
jgi:sulfoxide reductase heme-binding subunit YedZ